MGNQNQKFSITSNEVKLFKHMDNLKSLQQGNVRPVMFHISPTNKCNMGCSHCCFSGRVKHLKIPFPSLKSAIDQMAKLGVKSIELTGGGEPTLYEEINELIAYMKKKGFSIGINTNGLSINKVEDWGLFNWVRVSLNVLDLPSKEFEKFNNNVRFLKSKTKVTACYIASNGVDETKLRRVVKFAKSHKLPTRIAPDCIQQKGEIRALIDEIRTILTIGDLLDNDYIFLSDFNIFLGERKDNVCMIHMIKPFLYSDGWVYACPSSELAVENDRTMNPEFQICRMERILEYFVSRFEVKHFNCSYCKYTNQNNLLDAVVQETDDNEFC